MKKSELPWVLRGTPWVVRGRQPLFAGIYDDVIVSNGALLAVRAPVMSVETLAFAKRLERLVAKEHFIQIKLGNDTLQGIDVGALAGAVTDVWRSEKKSDRVHQPLANKCFDAIIKTVTEQAPGAIASFFGPDLFKPVKQ